MPSCKGYLDLQGGTSDTTFGTSHDLHPWLKNLCTEVFLYYHHLYVCAKIVPTLILILY